MMSKAELARKAGLSTLTIDRVEAGRPCRLDTKRKILLALGLKVSDKDRIFGGQPDEPETNSVQYFETHTTTSAVPVRASDGTSVAQEPVVAVVDAGPHDGKGEVTR